LQFQATTNQHYYLVVTNGGTLTNMMYGLVPQILGTAIRSNRQFEVRSGVGPPLNYTFQASAALGSQAAWSNLYTAIFPTNGATYLDTAATNFSKRFYRIKPGP
jgi:hypothetical protein